MFYNLHQARYHEHVWLYSNVELAEAYDDCMSTECDIHAILIEAQDRGLTIEDLEEILHHSSWANDDSF